MMRFLGRKSRKLDTGVGARLTMDSDQQSDSTLIDKTSTHPRGTHEVALWVYSSTPPWRFYPTT